MYGENIRACIVVNNGQTILFESLQIKNKINHEQEFQQLMNSQANNLIKNKSMQKSSTQSGVWYYVKDSEGLIYFILTSVSYKYPQVSQLMEEVQAKIRSADNYSDKIPQQLNNEIYNTLRYYDSNPNTSILQETQLNISNVKDAMKENVNKIVGNGEQLTHIESKTLELDSLSRQFNKDSYKLEKQMRLRMIKQKLVIAAIIILSIVGLYFLFFYSGDDDNLSVQNEEQNNQEEEQQQQDEQQNQENEEVTGATFLRRILKTKF